MEAIMAIALLCSTTASGLNRNLTETHRFQVKCQKEYVECYFGKTKAATMGDPAKFLHECIMDHQVPKVSGFSEL